MGIIEARNSPVALPIVPATKKDKIERLCIDSRMLNDGLGQIPCPQHKPHICPDEDVCLPTRQDKFLISKEPDMHQIN